MYYRLYYIDNYKCQLRKIYPSVDSTESIEEVEKKLITFKETNDIIKNIAKREQLVICEKNPKGWRIAKTIDEEIIKDLK